MRILTALLVCSNVWWFVMYFVQRHHNDELKDTISSLKEKICSLNQLLLSLQNGRDTIQVKLNKAERRIRGDEERALNFFRRHGYIY